MIIAVEMLRAGAKRPHAEFGKRVSASGWATMRTCQIWHEGRCAPALNISVTLHTSSPSMPANVDASAGVELYSNQFGVQVHPSS